MRALIVYRPACPYENIGLYFVIRIVMSLGILGSYCKNLI